VQEAPQFLHDRPRDLRRATPWHRYAYYVRTLPARLEAIAGEVPLPPGGRILDYGCADVPYRRFFPADADYVAADLPGNPDATLLLNSDSSVPSKDESFDLVLSTQVLEHVGEPDRYLAECYRVLRPGGRLLLSTHGIFVYHPDPDDYWRWTCAGLQRVVTSAGFEVERFEGVVGLAAIGLQLVHDAFVNELRWRRARQLLALVVQALIALADRLPQRSSEYDASVFALVARKPAPSAR
jgi:SAM-dependent methyltransferase